MLLTYYFSQMLAKHGPPLLDLAKFGSPPPPPPYQNHPPANTSNDF